MTICHVTGLVKIFPSRTKSGFGFGLRYCVTQVGLYRGLGKLEARLCKS